jgi:hypothetical protein
MMPLLIWFVRGSIALNDQLRIATIKVRDVIAKLMLPSEFEPDQLTISKKLPQQCFS